jgi:DNA-binding FadR family transcriptional regulator
MLSISRGTVREAVRVLVSHGYLETRQGSGTYVRATRDLTGPLSVSRRVGLRDQYETRLALEVEGARLAAIRQTPDVIAALRGLLVLRGEREDGDLAGFIERDLAFHRAIMVASRNKALVEIYDIFSVSIAETIEAGTYTQLPEPDMKAHERIVAAIATGDPATADAAVRTFMAPVFVKLDELHAP